ncbi:MAG: MarR family transcriptional regulator [Alphaproteobacteria bacterium]|nr:MarR family transcriptional regulator [Alphaproteobacteria bacterium]
MARRKTTKTGPADAGFVLDSYILYNLVRATSTYTDEMSKVLKSFGLSTTKWRILMLLHDRSPSSVGELARRSVTKMPTLTRMLIRMEEDGLITRRALKGDRRIVNVTMTPKAVKTLRMVRSIGQKVFDRAIEGISADEIAGTTQTLQRMRANLERSPYESLEECANETGVRLHVATRRKRAS